MKERPTPETDAFFRSFADGDATPSHAEYYDRMMQLERERDEARAEVQAIQHWATANGTIQMQREIDEAREQRDKLAEAARFVIEDSDLACGHFWPDVVKRCQEALAAVEGGKP